jgi:hypothetical protein
LRKKIGMTTYTGFRGSESATLLDTNEMAKSSATSPAQQRKNCQDQRVCRRRVLGVQTMIPFWVWGVSEMDIFFLGVV